MMLATPVRSSAWSSTSSTLARAARGSVAGMDLRRQMRRFPGQHYFSAAARRRDDRQRGADAVGPFLHARHAEATGRAFTRNAAAVVGNGQTQPERVRRRGADRDPVGAGVPYGIGQRLLSDADDLAFDAVTESRQFVEVHLNRNVRCLLGQLGEIG